MRVAFPKLTGFIPETRDLAPPKLWKSTVPPFGSENAKRAKGSNKTTYFFASPVYCDVMSLVGEQPHISNSDFAWRTDSTNRHKKGVAVWAVGLTNGLLSATLITYSSSRAHLRQLFKSARITSFTSLQHIDAEPLHVSQMLS
jgi:hypothetical protein